MAQLTDIMATVDHGTTLIRVWSTGAFEGDNFAAEWAGEWPHDYEDDTDDTWEPADISTLQWAAIKAHLGEHGLPAGEPADYVAASYPRNADATEIWVGSKG